MRTPTILLLGAVAGCAPGDAVPERPVSTLSGEATWRWTFDDGSTCAYDRFSEGIEDRSAPWLVPEADLFRVSVTMDGEACARRVGVDPSPRLEHHGLGPDGWWRGGVDEPLFLQGWADETEEWASHSASDWVDLGTEAGRFELEARFEVGQGRGDPLHGHHATDDPACGWALVDAPTYRGDHRLQVGGELPDARLEDACGETVRLHGLTGRYLLIDLAAMDCGPCQAMAAGEGAFRAQMAREGVAIETVTLLTPGLSQPWAAASARERAAWAEAFDLHGPVLGDRSWGAVVVADALDGELAYPSWVLVGPDRTVLAVERGFAGWDAVAERLRAATRPRGTARK